MEKRFLLLLMSLLCMASLQAADYYYSHTARYKSMGTSILANGDFADGTRGWTNQDGENVNAEIWSVESGVAPDGGYSIRRRRECIACGKRFTTYERVEQYSVFVVKRDGRREKKTIWTSSSMLTAVS